MAPISKNLVGAMSVQLFPSLTLVNEKVTGEDSLVSNSFPFFFSPNFAFLSLAEWLSLVGRNEKSLAG